MESPSLAWQRANRPLTLQQLQRQPLISTYPLGFNFGLPWQYA